MIRGGSDEDAYEEIQPFFDERDYIHIDLPVDIIFWILVISFVVVGISHIEEKS